MARDRARYSQDCNCYLHQERQLEQFPGVVLFISHSTCVKQFRPEGEDHSS